MASMTQFLASPLMGDKLFGASRNSLDKGVARLAKAIEEADAIVVGAGAGLSTSAGFTYTGNRFKQHFADFEERYGFHDMYSGGFYPYATLEEYWAYWSRYIYWNRYDQPAGQPYLDLVALLEGKDYFVITTNVDHRFQVAGIDKGRLFYTQGDYGLWQCSEPCHKQTYDNEDQVRRMVVEQKNMRVPSELVPHCPKCGKPMTMNLRADNTFVEDTGWDKAAERYAEFMRRHKGLRIVFLELGVGGNTPVIIKYPFWAYASENANAIYACINKGECYTPVSLEKRTILIDGDIGEALAAIRKQLG